MEGLVEGRRVETFVSADQAPPPVTGVKEVRSALQRWVERARAAGRG
jgi:hypothetical protein